MIGVALSDPTGTIASPHTAIRAERSDRPPKGLIDLVRDVAPVAIVLGIPVNMDGSEGEMAREAREFGRSLARATGISVVEWDERLTSARARRSLAESGRKAKKRGPGEEDMIAAAHLLRSYMDSLASALEEEE